MDTAMLAAKLGKPTTLLENLSGRQVKSLEVVTTAVETGSYTLGPGAQLSLTSALMSYSGLTETATAEGNSWFSNCWEDAPQAAAPARRRVPVPAPVPAPEGPVGEPAQPDEEELAGAGDEGNHGNDRGAHGGGDELELDYDSDDSA